MSLDVLTISARGMWLSEALKSSVEKSILAATKRFSHLRISKINVILDAGNKNNRVTINFSSAELKLSCTANEDNVYKSLSKCKKRLQEKIKKYMAKTKRHKKNRALKYSPKTTHMSQIICRRPVALLNLMNHRSGRRSKRVQPLPQ